MRMTVLFLRLVRLRADLATLATRHQGLIQALSASIAFGLGLWGWAIHNPPLNLADRFEIVFRTVQLITLQFPTYPRDAIIPWQLQVARLLVPLAVFFAILHFAAFVTRRLQGPIWVIAVAIALGLGLWGWAIYNPPVNLADWFDNIFHTAQLIMLQFPTTLEFSIPWQLQIARLLVPLLALFAIFNLLMDAAWQRSIAIQYSPQQSTIAIQHSPPESMKRPTPQPRGSKIFISYRRLDTSHIAGRIYDRLAREMPENEVFFDVDTIPIGVNFKQHISSAVGSSAVMLVLVGEKWLSLNWRQSRWWFRSRPKEDFVQAEIKSALDLGVPIVPLLVDNVAMPHLDDLPNSIAEFVSLNAAEVRSGRDFHKDMDRVLEIIGPLRERGISLKQG